MNKKEKRELAVIFVILVLTAAVVMAISINKHKASAASAAIVEREPEYSDYLGKKIGILKGSSFEEQSYKYFPGSEYRYYDSLGDLIPALSGGDIDCFISDEPILRMVTADDPEISYIDEVLKAELYSFVFQKDSEKGSMICDQFNLMLAGMTTDGSLEELEEKWFDNNGSAKISDMELSGENGELVVFVIPTNAPFAYISDGELVGYAIELIYMFCREYGYSVRFEQENISSGLEGISSGKYDIGADPVTITSARQESVLFSDPIYRGGITIAVRKSDFYGNAEQ